MWLALETYYLLEVGPNGYKAASALVYTGLMDDTLHMRMVITRSCVYISRVILQSANVSTMSSVPPCYPISRLVGA